MGFLGKIAGRGGAGDENPNEYLHNIHFKGGQTMDDLIQVRLSEGRIAWKRSVKSWLRLEKSLF